MEKWLRSRFGSITVTSDGEDLRVDCPFCEARFGAEDNKAHLYINLKTPVAHCFRCSWKGHWLTLVMSVDGCSYGEALRYLERPPQDIRRFDRVYSPRGLLRADKFTDMPDGFIPMMNLERAHPEHKAVAAYARMRFRKMPLRRSLVEFNNMADRLWRTRLGIVPGTHRLWILIDEHWWQGRAIAGQEPKYLSPPWPKGDSLWNAAALSRMDGITICEGVFSAIAVGSNAIALCSKEMGAAQARRIVNKTRARRITIMLDADAEDDAVAVAQGLIEAGYGGQILIHSLFNGDPCDGLDGETWPYGFQSVVAKALA